MSKQEYDPQARQINAIFSNKKQAIVTHLICKEAISETYHLSISIAASEEINHDIIAKPITIKYNHPLGEKSYSAFILSLEFTGINQDKSLFYYQIEAFDVITLMQFNRTTRLFQNMSTQAIILEIANELQLSRYFDFSLAKQGQKHDLKIQCDETDYDFIKRILSEEGWHYHFEHQNQPLVVISDSNHKFKRTDIYQLDYQTKSTQQINSISNWHSKKLMATQEVYLRQYLLESSNQMEKKKIRPNEKKAGALQRYIFNPSTQNKHHLNQRAQHCIENYETQSESHTAQSNIPALESGKRFYLQQHPISRFNQEYVIKSIIHEIKQQESLQDNLSYQNQFECIAYDLPFRPKIIDKPKIHYLHTGTITGTKNASRYSDELGRVKVKFHWDLSEIENENSSCWIPVSQIYAGDQRGFQFIPRIGDDVLIQYLNGDPDQPVVMGMLHNQKNRPPFQSETQSGIQSENIPKQKNKKGNAFIFEDKTDHQKIEFYAAKDWLAYVENNATWQIQGEQIYQIEKNFQTKIKGQYTLSCEKDYQCQSSENIQFKSSQNLELKSNNRMDLNANTSIKLDGKTIQLSAMQKIELKVGNSSLVLTPSGITLNAAQINIKGQAKTNIQSPLIQIKAQGKASISGTLLSLSGSAMTEVKAGAMVQIQGTITKVN